MKSYEIHLKIVQAVDHQFDHEALPLWVSGCKTVKFSCAKVVENQERIRSVSGALQPSGLMSHFEDFRPGCGGILPIFITCHWDDPKWDLDAFSTLAQFSTFTYIYPQ